jgi:hypothetical protein
MNYYFKCFIHKLRKVEAVCTDILCTKYRFFCVQCFFEYTDHFMNHKENIHEVSDIMNFY